MNSKFIIKVGEEHYGSGFHINGRTRNNWPNSFLTKNIDEARVFNNVGTAKAMATRIQGILLEWIKATPGSNYLEWEPISVVEIRQVIGLVVDTKPSIREEIQ
jgi:hypothetical protein